MKKYFLFTICLLVLSACTSTNVEEKAKSTVENNKSASVPEEKNASTKEDDPYKNYVKKSLALIAGEGLILVPKECASSAHIFEDNGGVLNITCSEKFDLRIVEQLGDVSDKIAALESEVIYKTTILDQSKTSIIYERSLPDGSNKMFHFYRTMELKDNTPITVYSANNGIFKKSHVDRMIKSTNSIQLVE